MKYKNDVTCQTIPVTPNKEEADSFERYLKYSKICGLSVFSSEDDLVLLTSLIGNKF